MRSLLLFAVTATPMLQASSASAQTPAESPVARQIAAAEASLAAIEALSAAERTVTNTLLALDDVQARFFVDTRMASFMAQVSTDAAQRERGREVSAAVSGWFDRLYQREGIYRVLADFAAQEPELEPEFARYLEFLLRDYRRAGMQLGAEQRGRLAAIEEELTELSIEFQRNIADDETVVLLTAAECPGVPEHVLESLPRSAELYTLELKGGPPGIFLATCTDEDTRMKISISYGKRGGRRNVRVLEKILLLRAEKARLLGYASIAAFSTEVKMARDPATVEAFYADLRPRLRAKAEADFEELSAAKREHLGDPAAVLNVWDFSFYKAWLMRERYAVDSQVVREYFPMERVVAGLFEVTEELFGLSFADVTEEARAAGRPLWHADVRLYTVTDAQSGELLGEFYTDLYPREGKYSHAAQFPLQPRKRWVDGSLSKPLVALVCNFTKPTESRPSLLSHAEVETFFHEFGHCLHSILTEGELSEFAGTNVARDFVEAPSQMLENWIWDAQVLARFARHYETGEPLPKAMLAGMLAAKNLGSGLATEGQVYLGMMDLAYHTDPTGEVDTDAVRREVYLETRIFPPTDHIWSQASFGHLMGYHAGYYGYLWSLVYAQDMFSRFEETDPMDKAVAAEYRKRVLARGGSVDALELVRDFLGREPNAAAFLRHLGLRPE